MDFNAPLSIHNFIEDHRVLVVVTEGKSGNARNICLFLITNEEGKLNNIDQPATVRFEDIIFTKYVSFNVGRLNQNEGKLFQ